MRKNQIQYTFQNSCQEKRSPNNCTCNKQSRPRQLTHDNETGKKRSGISASTHPQPIEHPKQTTHTTTETAAYFKQGQKREEDNGQDHRHRQDLIDRPTNELLATKPIRGYKCIVGFDFDARQQTECTDTCTARAVRLAGGLHRATPSQPIHSTDDAGDGIALSSARAKQTETSAAKRLDHLERRSGEDPSIAG